MFNKINKKIIDVLGIGDLPIEKQNEVMEEIGALVYQSVITKSLDMMNAEDKNLFEKLISTNQNPEAMFTYLGEKIKNIEELTEEEAHKFREESELLVSEIVK